MAVSRLVVVLVLVLLALCCAFDNWDEHGQSNFHPCNICGINGGLVRKEDAAAMTPLLPDFEEKLFSRTCSQVQTMAMSGQLRQEVCVLLSFQLCGCVSPASSSSSRQTPKNLRQSVAVVQYDSGSIAPPLRNLESSSTLADPPPPPPSAAKAASARPALAPPSSIVAPGAFLTSREIPLEITANITLDDLPGELQGESLNLFEAACVEVLSVELDTTRDLACSVKSQLVLEPDASTGPVWVEVLVTGVIMASLSPHNSAGDVTRAPATTDLPHVAMRNPEPTIVSAPTPPPVSASRTPTSNPTPSLSTRSAAPSSAPFVAVYPPTEPALMTIPTVPISIRPRTSPPIVNLPPSVATPLKPIPVPYPTSPGLPREQDSTAAPSLPSKRETNQVVTAVLYMSLEDVFELEGDRLVLFELACAEFLTVQLFSSNNWTCSVQNQETVEPSAGRGPIQVELLISGNGAGPEVADVSVLDSFHEGADLFIHSLQEDSDDNFDGLFRIRVWLKSSSADDPAAFVKDILGLARSRFIGIVTGACFLLLTATALCLFVREEPPALPCKFTRRTSASTKRNGSFPTLPPRTDSIFSVCAARPSDNENSELSSTSPPLRAEKFAQHTGSPLHSPRIMIPLVNIGVATNQTMDWGKEHGPSCGFNIRESKTTYHNRVDTATPIGTGLRRWEEVEDDLNQLPTTSPWQSMEQGIVESDDSIILQQELTSIEFDIPAETTAKVPVAKEPTPTGILVYNKGSTISVSKKKEVSFDSLHVREYERCVDSSLYMGLSLGWGFVESDPISLAEALPEGSTTKSLKKSHKGGDTRNVRKKHNGERFSLFLAYGLTRKELKQEAAIAAEVWQQKQKALIKEEEERLAMEKKFQREAKVQNTTTWKTSMLFSALPFKHAHASSAPKERGPVQVLASP